MGAGAGGVIQGAFGTVGSMRSQKAQMQAHAQNAQAYQEQADYIQEVGKRKLRLLGRTQEQEYQKQVSQFAKAGVGFNGSVLEFLSDTKVEQRAERFAVDREIKQEVNFARRRATQEEARADNVAEWSNFNTAGSFLGSTAGSFGEK